MSEGKNCNLLHKMLKMASLNYCNEVLFAKDDAKFQGLQMRLSSATDLKIDSLLDFHSLRHAKEYKECEHNCKFIQLTVLILLTYFQ